MPRKPFETPRGIEKEYGRKLKGIARNIFRIVNRFFDRKNADASEVVTNLNLYGEKVAEWAETSVEMVAKRMLANSRRDWNRISKRMSRAARVAMTQDGSQIEAAQRWMNEQVGLIKSLPREAAERAQQLAFDAVTKGERFETIEKQIKRLGEITDNRARLIARTEVARANSLINNARAQSLKFYRSKNLVRCRKLIHQVFKILCSFLKCMMNSCTYHAFCCSGRSKKENALPRDST